MSAAFAAGDLRTRIDSVFPLADASQAMARNMAGHTQGKVVLDVAA